MNPPYVFIVNPLSGAGHGNIIARLLRQMLPQHPAFSDGKGIIHFITELDASALSDVLAHTTAAIAVGGDGTVSRLLPHILHCGSPPALGLIPLGTSNDLARALGIPVTEDYTRAPGLQAALDRIASSEPRGLDVCRVNGELFFSNYFSIGFDAAIVRDFDRARAARWARLFPPRRLTNNLLYFLMGIKNAGFHLEPEITIDCRTDTENHRTKLSSRCRTIIVTNLPVYAGGCRIRSEALIDDGLFEVTVVSTLGQYVKLILTRFLPFLEPSRRMSRFTAENAVIRLKTISPCQKDGERCSEPAAATETYEIMFHSPIRVLAPAPPYGETGAA